MDKFKVQGYVGAAVWRHPRAAVVQGPGLAGVWPGPVSAGENGGEATCRNLPEQRPVGEMRARQLSSVGLPKGKVSVAIPGGEVLSGTSRNQG